MGQQQVVELLLQVAEGAPEQREGLERHHAGRQLVQGNQLHGDGHARSAISLFGLEGKVLQDGQEAGDVLRHSRGRHRRVVFDA